MLSRLMCAISVAGLMLLLPVAALAAGASGIGSLEVDSYQEDFGVSAAEAEERLELQHRGAGVVELLERAAGAGYAGVWFDNSTGQFVVPLSDSSSRVRVESTLEGAGLRGSFRTVASQYSWNELKETHTRVDEELLPLIRKRLVQTSLDPRTNAVVIDLAQSARGVQREKVGEVGERTAVEVRERKAELFKTGAAGCNETLKSCGRPLRAGVAIDRSGGRCTAAFKAVSKATGDRFLLTAGHCVAPSPQSAWVAYDESGQAATIGTPQAFSFPEHDWAAINATGSWWDVNPWPSQAVIWGTEESRSITSEGFSFFGQQVCHVGATTGANCGTVTGLDKTVGYGNGKEVLGYMFHTTEVKGSSFCVISGDSGGPVLAGNTALGIITQRLPGDTCPNTGYYIEITEATDALNMSVAPRPPVPGWKFMRGLSSGSGISSWSTAIGMDTPKMALGDISGDGRADVVTVERDNGLYRYKLGLSNGSGIPSWGQVLSGMGSPTRLAVGDLTGDGKADIVAVEPEGNGKYRYMLGTSNGAGFSSWSQMMGEMSYPHKLAVGDLTGDGKADIVVVESQANGKYRYMLGNSSGAGIGSWSQVMSEMSYAEFMDLGDFNADGKADIVAVEAQGNGKYRYMLGTSNGAGIGSWSQEMSEMSGPYFLSAGDFNSDGKEDVIAVEADGGSTFRYMLGTSNGTGIGSWSQVLGGKKLPRRSDLGDLTGDGKADIVSIETETTGSYSYRLGISSGSAVPSWNLMGSWMGVPQEADVGDVDADGKADLVSVEPEGNGSYRYALGLSNASGIASNWKPVLTGKGRPNALAVGDLTGDGKADIVAVEPEGNGKYRYMLGTSNGAGFSSWSSALSGMGLPTRMDLGDFNADGKADVIAFEPDGSGKYRIMRGLSNGSGISSWSQVLGGLSYPHKAAIGDLTGDGKADVVSVEADGSGKYRYMLGKSSGTGISSWSQIIGSMTYAEVMDLGDLNADGKADVMSVESQGNGKYRFMLGTSNGAGIGSWSQVMSEMSGPYFFHAADLDGDGKDDIVSVETG